MFGDVTMFGEVELNDETLMSGEMQLDSSL